jgi:hypothetical protein
VQNTPDQIERRPGGHFAPGTSGNRRGRPRVGESLAAAVRQKFPPDRLLEIAEKLIASKDSADVKYAHGWLTDRGYGKAPIEVNLGRADELDDDDPSLLTDQELEAAIAIRRGIQARRALASGDRPALPPASDATVPHGVPHPVGDPQDD